jgi:hypothetical protein
MTDYTDVPRVTTLHGENERTQSAINNLDAGGALANFTIIPPAPSTGLIPPQPGPMLSPVTITLEQPASDQLLADLRAWLVARQQRIEAELESLGVTNPPSTTA